MSTTAVYMLMVHMLGSPLAPYWHPLQYPLQAYTDPEPCVKRAELYMAVIPEAVFGCPKVEVN